MSWCAFQLVLVTELAGLVAAAAIAQESGYTPVPTLSPPSGAGAIFASSSSSRGVGVGEIIGFVFAALAACVVLYGLYLLIGWLCVVIAADPVTAIEVATDVAETAAEVAEHKKESGAAKKK